MRYDPERLEQFLMKTEEMIEALPPGTDSIELSKVTEALGLSQDEGQKLAEQLAREEWIHPPFRPNPPVLQITHKGRKAARAFTQKSKRSWWMRQWEDNPKLAAAIIAVATVIVSELLKHLFWPSK